MLTGSRLLVGVFAVALAGAMGWASVVVATGAWFENGQRFGLIVTGWLAAGFAVLGAWKLAK